MRWLGWMLALMSLGALVGCGGPGGPTPAAPTNVTVAAGAGFVDVTWEHDGANVTGFAIYRNVVAVGAAAAGTPLAEVGAAARSYRDTTTVPGVPYRYAVAAKGGGRRASMATPHEGEPVAAGEPRSVAFEFLWRCWRRGATCGRWRSARTAAAW